MKKYAKYVIIVTIVIICILVICLLNKNSSENVDNSKFKIVTSFYPIYIMTSNITEGASDIELINMSDTNIGCIHNYTISTEDMKKIEKADVFIENGLGLESFVDNVAATNKDLQIINSSENISNLIKHEDEINPHIWTSISNYIIQTQNISKELAEKNPENAELYKKNTEEYVQKLMNLKTQTSIQLQDLQGKSALCLNESFEYLGQELKLDLTTIHTDHEESTMSAEMLKNTIDLMKKNNTKIIIVDINDDLKSAQTIANETEAQIYKLDSASSGSMNKDAYLNIMNGNIEKLKNRE